MRYPKKPSFPTRIRSNRKSNIPKQAHQDLFDLQAVLDHVGTKMARDQDEKSHHGSGKSQTPPSSSRWSTTESTSDSLGSKDSKKHSKGVRLWGALLNQDPDRPARFCYCCTCACISGKSCYICGDTYRSLWQTSRKVETWYMIYRLCHSMLALFAFVISLAFLFIYCPKLDEGQQCQDYGPPNPGGFFYLTPWCVTLNAGQSVLGLYLVVRAAKRQAKVAEATEVSRCRLRQAKEATECRCGCRLKQAAELTRCRCGCRLTQDSDKSEDKPECREHLLFTLTGSYWALNTTAMVMSILVNTVYWPLKSKSERSDTALKDMAEHSMMTILAGSDFALKAFPVAISHSAVFAVFVTLYVLACGIFSLCGGTDQKHKPHLYPFLNWKKPWTTFGVSCGMMFVGNLTLLLLVLLDYIRRKFRPNFTDGYS